MSWQDLKEGAPEIARLGRERFDETRVALLGTLRRDGSPRISPIEPCLTDDNLLFGAMAWSLKVRDLQRDPRCVVHSAVSGPDRGEGELRLYGHALEAGPQLRDSCRGGWWIDRPRESAWVFSLEIEEATFIEWDFGSAEMIVRRWSPKRGVSQSRRTYP